MRIKTSLSPVLAWMLLSISVHARGTSTFRRSSDRLTAREHSPSPSQNLQNWSYSIPNDVQNGTSHARFNIPTPESTLTTEALLALDAPQLSSINASVFDWWYFDAVSDTNPRESLVVTFFTSSAAAFPFLNPKESSVLIAHLWASFANGSVFADFAPATAATVAGGESSGNPSLGEWSATGFNWTALEDDLSRYEIVVASEKLQVEGRFALSSGLKPHLPCGIQPEGTILEIAPHIGWASPTPDARGAVDMKIQGSKLSFQGPAYHDRNWSDRAFMESVQSWYWGHGRLGPYSIVWFSYLALDDPTNTTYVSSYVARDGEILVSACHASALTVRPCGRAGTTGGRYPPRAGDIPDGFHLEFDLGGSDGWLKVNVSVEQVVAGDNQYYMRWTGNMMGEVVQMQSSTPEVCGTANSIKTKHRTSESSLSGVAVFEQFALVD